MGNERAENLISTADESGIDLLLNIFDCISNHSTDKFLDALIFACSELQSNRIYYQASEDDRNTFVESILTSSGYSCKDQTRRGRSSKGKSAGELDIFISEPSKRPFTVIEALILKYLDKSYVDLHLKKVFGYDTFGTEKNFILVYSEAKEFVTLWSKYVNYLPKVQYPYEYLKFEDLSKNYSCTDIKIGKSQHLRQQQEVYLFHIMVNMHK